MYSCSSCVTSCCTRNVIFIIWAFNKSCRGPGRQSSARSAQVDTWHSLASWYDYIIVRYLHVSISCNLDSIRFLLELEEVLIHAANFLYSHKRVVASKFRSQASAPQPYKRTLVMVWSESAWSEWTAMNGLGQIWCVNPNDSGTDDVVLRRNAFWAVCRPLCIAITLALHVASWPVFDFITASTVVLATQSLHHPLGASDNFGIDHRR